MSFGRAISPYGPSLFPVQTRANDHASLCSHVCTHCVILGACPTSSHSMGELNSIYGLNTLYQCTIIISCFDRYWGECSRCYDGGSRALLLTGAWVQALPGLQRPGGAALMPPLPRPRAPRVLAESFPVVLLIGACHILPRTHGLWRGGAASWGGG